MAYPRAIKPNYGLDQANLFALNLGTPALAAVARFVTSTNMKVGSYTIANASPPDGLARNVTVKRAVITGADTPGTILITGTNAAGAVISETIIPGADGVVVAGLKAFKTVTSAVGAGWIINTGNDTIEIGFGDLIGLPALAGGMWQVWAGKLAGTATAWAVTGYVASTVVAPTVVADADELEKTTFDLSSGTYNGSKRVFVLLAQ